MTYLATLFFGSSLALASPPNKYTLLPINVNEWPSLGHGGGPFRGALGFILFHSHLEACSSNNSLLKNLNERIKAIIFLNKTFLAQLKFHN